MTREITILALHNECRQAAPVVADQMTRKNPFENLLVQSFSTRRAFNNPKGLRPRIQPKFEMQ
jgi:hypothetical protein